MQKRKERKRKKQNHDKTMMSEHINQSEKSEGNKKSAAYPAGGAEGEDYLQFFQQICSREAVTRRFFLVSEYEPMEWHKEHGRERGGRRLPAVPVHTAVGYLYQCRNEVVFPDNKDEFTIDVLYNLLCRKESAAKPLPVRAKEVVAQYLANAREAEDVR